MVAFADWPPPEAALTIATMLAFGLEGDAKMDDSGDGVRRRPEASGDAPNARGRIGCP